VAEWRAEEKSSLYTRGGEEMRTLGWTSFLETTNEIHVHMHYGNRKFVIVLNLNKLGGQAKKAARAKSCISKEAGGALTVQALGFIE
jgi:hypothetical protein